MKPLCVILILCLLFVPAAAAVDGRGEAILRSVSAPIRPETSFTVVLDAGHGGEDGGALAPDGTPEKEINLSISNMIAAYFDLFGVQYIAVRRTDVSVGDRSLSTVKARKTSDILTRYALVNDTENAVLLSIHQNQFSQPQYSGTQVFYAPDDAASELLAQSIQHTVTTHLQPKNGREVKASGDSIYLLYHAKRPSVLVECGFLSNAGELALLKTGAYQSQMAFFIIEGFLAGLRDLST